MRQIIKDLLSFIHLASTSTFASDKPDLLHKEFDGSTSIIFVSEDWKYHDNYFGGEPYGGREVVFYKNKPIWMMVYYGWIEEDNDPKIIYPVLTEALRHSPKDMPYRGPQEYKTQGFIYKNTVDGDVKNFIGEEFILNDKNEVVFSTSYCGGLIDQ